MDIKKFGKYLLLEAQEQTRVGVTWRAAELANGKIDRNLLVDLVDLKLISDKAFVDSYLSQSQISAKMEHPNILSKFNTLNEHGQIASVYEYQEGFTLSRVFERCQSDGFPFSIDHSLLVVSKLLAALAYAKNKHITHGFVNPAMILVTHEGEIKLRGFAMSHALRSHAQDATTMDPYYTKYMPPGSQHKSQSPDILDIYGCGSILFEMLTGQSFNNLNGDAASKIANAVTETEGEQIPTQIANILVSSLDLTAPSVYTDIQRMSKEMEELLYSGEYSPTTFNLAFFMHSAFRIEMEELTEKIAAEKERDYSKQSAPAMPPPRAEIPKAAPPVSEPIMPDPAPEPEVYASTRVDASASSGGGKSKMPMIVGAVVVVLLLAVAGYFMTGSGENKEDKKFAEAEAQLRADAVKQEELRRAKAQDEIARQNELLRKQLEELKREETERKKREMQDSIDSMDAEMAALEKQEADAKEKEEIRKQMAKLQKDKERLEAEKKQREEDERKAEERRKAEMAYLEKQNNDTTTSTTTNSDSTPAVNSDAPATVVADNATSPISAPAVELRPPQRGEIVEFDDPLLVHPAFLSGATSEIAPRKAIRNGLVKKNKTLMYMMRALVNENGEVEDVVLHSSQLADSEDDFGMTTTATKMVKKLKFTPPKKMGVPVKVWWLVTIHFRAK